MTAKQIAVFASSFAGLLDGMPEACKPPQTNHFRAYSTLI
jgi:hypothetical protein